MDIQKTIQLGDKRYVNSVNTDSYHQIQLENDKKQLIEYDIKNVLNVSDTFYNERQNTEIYRIYGRIDYLSILNGLKTDYDDLIDFFTQQTDNSKTLLNSFDWYLLKPSTGYTSLGSDLYVRNFKVITKLSEFDIHKSGFFVNIYNEQQYIFNFKKSIDVTEQVDALGFPITELYLYPIYKKAATNVNGNSETLERLNFPLNNKVSLTYTTLTTGDTVYGDVIEHDALNYSYDVVSAQTYFIRCQYSGASKSLLFKYNPFIKITLNALSSEVEQVNVSGTSYEEVVKIPYYAIESSNNDGNFIWRDILPKGFFDPINGQGVNFPFINQKHYVFNNFLLSVVPDLTDVNTDTVFSEIKYGGNSVLYNRTNTLNNLGKLC